MSFKIIAFIFAVVLFGCQKQENHSSKVVDDKDVGTNESYYTCTMHPQIHESHPGNCPICGMPLVKVLHKTEKDENFNAILPTDYQKKVLQFTHGKVESREVSFEIPVGGRLLSSSQVAFYIYEADLMRVKPGLSFEGECSSMPGVNLKGKIVQIDTVADPSSRAVRVVGTISSTHNMKLLEGSFFGKILSSSRSALMIPYDAVLRTGKQNIVYKVDAEGGLVPVRVALGLTLDDEVEILSGLQEGDEIAFGPNFLMDSESRLKGNDMSSMEGM